MSYELSELRGIMNEGSSYGPKAKGSKMSLMDKVKSVATYTACFIAGTTGLILLIPVALAMGLIAIPAVLSAKVDKKATEADTLEVSADEFKLLLTNMEAIQNTLLKKQQSSKYSGIYKHHKYKPNFFDGATGKSLERSQVESQFKSGKEVYPSLMVAYYFTDMFDKDGYTEFYKNRPMKDRELYEDANEKYYRDAEQDIIDELEKHVDALDLDKYENVEINVKVTGDMGVIYIYPKTNKYYKLAK